MNAAGRAGSLGFRMVAIFGVVLLPLAILASTQTVRLTVEADAATEAAVLGRTLQIVAPEVDLILRGQGVAQALAAALETPARMDIALCTSILRTAVDISTGQYTFAGFIPTDGRMSCASTGEPYDFSASEGLARLNADPRPTMTVNRKGPISGESVLIFSHPVRAEQDRPAGYVSLSMPHRALAGVVDGLADVAGTKDVVLMTFDADGEVLTATGGLDGVPGWLPRDSTLAAFVGRQAASFTATDTRGRRRVFAVVPLRHGELYALGSWPPNSTPFGVGSKVSPHLFMGLMWLASLVVAWMATEHQVLRHVRSLRASITAFARGDRSLKPLDLRGAPTEIAEVGEAYERMAEGVLHDEADLQDTVHQKEVLLREVHHRVKNNLQLIASIMNMQIRQARTDEARVLMKGLQDRVMSLATVHRELYQTSGLADVASGELLGRISRQVLRLGAGQARAADAQIDVADIRLTPDHAVPLALFLTEALTNALKYGNGALLVRFRRTGDLQAELRIENAIGPAVAPEDGSGLGSQLLRAFAQQLGGTTEVSQSDGVYRLALRFNLRPLTDAEESTARGDPAPADT